MYVEYLISGEGEVEAAAQSHLPQLLGGLVCIQAGVTQQEADYKEHSQPDLCLTAARVVVFGLRF